MAESKIFKLIDGIECEDVGRAVEAFLRDRKHLYTEGVKVPEGYFVQAKEETKWKKFTGMDASVQVRIIPTGDMVNIDIGTGKWVEKAGIAAAGMVVFAPLAVTAAIGAWNSKKLPQEIFDYIEHFIMSGGRNVSVSMSINQALKEDQIACPVCKAVNQKGQKFCSACGAKLGAECPHCHSEIPQGVRFCPNCGQPATMVRVCVSCGAQLEGGAKFCASCGTPVTPGIPENV